MLECIGAPVIGGGEDIALVYGLAVIDSSRVAYECGYIFRPYDVFFLIAFALNSTQFAVMIFGDEVYAVVFSIYAIFLCPVAPEVDGLELAFVETGSEQISSREFLECVPSPLRIWVILS